MGKEYWKITDTLRLIKIAKEDKKKGIVETSTITKDYINHLSTNINLMKEAAEHERREIVKMIEEEKVIVKKACLGLVHPSGIDQEVFTEWLQNTVDFHLNQLLIKLK